MVLTLATSCSSDSTGGRRPEPTSIAAGTSPGAPALAGDELYVGASSRSLLPTVGGSTAYLGRSPGFFEVDPFDPGEFLSEFDQGRIEMLGRDNSAVWVHDDIRATAVVFKSVESMVVMVGADLAEIDVATGAEIEASVRELLPDTIDTVEIVFVATSNPHSPSLSGSPGRWRDFAVDQFVEAISAALTSLEPATLSVAEGEHRFGVNDTEDPTIIDPAMRVVSATSIETGDLLATLVQWANRADTTRGFAPESGYDISAQCDQLRDGGPDDCTAAGRYLTSDFPGVMRDVVRSQIGGEVLYLGGAIGRRIGPVGAYVWNVDETHPLGDGWTVPPGALPVAGASNFTDTNFARAEAIGTQLGESVLRLVPQATPVLAATTASDKDLEWREAGNPGDIRVVHVRIGSVGFLFVPSELPPEFVIGLPSDWPTDADRYGTSGEANQLPGYLLNLIAEPFASVAAGAGLGGTEGDVEAATNVDDMWAAAVQLFGRDDPQQVNPDHIGYPPREPPPGP